MKCLGSAGGLGSRTAFFLAPWSACLRPSANIWASGALQQAPVEGCGRRSFSLMTRLCLARFCGAATRDLWSFETGPRHLPAELSFGVVSLQALLRRLITIRTGSAQLNLKTPLSQDYLLLMGGLQACTPTSPLPLRLLQRCSIYVRALDGVRGKSVGFSKACAEHLGSGRALLSKTPTASPQEPTSSQQQEDTCELPESPTTPAYDPL